MMQKYQKGKTMRRATIMGGFRRQSTATLNKILGDERRLTSKHVDSDSNRAGSNYKNLLIQASIEEEECFKFSKSSRGNGKGGGTADKDVNKFCKVFGRFPA